MTLLFLQINRYTQVTVVPHFVYSTFLFWTQFSLYIYTSTMTIKQFYWCHCTLLLTPTANPLQKPLSLTLKGNQKKNPALSLISLQTTKPWLKNHFNMTLLFLQINRYTQVTVVPHFVYSTFLFWTQFSLYIYTSTMTIKQFYWCHCTLLLTPTANPLQKPLSLTVVWGITLLVQKTNFFS